MNVVSSVVPFRTRTVVHLIILLICCSSAIPARQHKPSAIQTNALQSAAGVPSSTVLNVNNLSMWANRDGVLDYQSATEQGGLIFPPGGTTVTFKSGFVWGGLVFDGSGPTMRVGGQTVFSGLRPGRIVRPGIAENPDNGDVRIFRIRRAWQTADLTRDAAEIFGVRISQVSPSQIESVREQYRRDWLEWPWEKGAPYYERNGILGYQPHPDGTPDSLYDEPGLAEADQVIWFVANDLDENATGSLYGAPPIGLELQITLWAYAHQLQNVAFQRYRLIYKGTATTPNNAVIDPMYLAKWADTDIGNFIDDFAGYDSTRDLAFAYNSTATDQEFERLELTPPSVGYDLLQGPRVIDPAATARWNLRTISGYRNLPASMGSYFTEDTRISDYNTGQYSGAVEWWNLLRGYAPAASSTPPCLTDPYTNACTPFELTGDPVAIRGWLDGRFTDAGDRRVTVGAGPFRMAVGDTQEVVIGVVGGIGKDHRDAVAAMRESDDAAQDFSNLNFAPFPPVPQPSLRIVELDRKFLIEWESDTAKIRQTETYNSMGYRFETYQLYQLPSPTASLEEGTPFPPFDITQPRFLEVTQDLIRNKPLVNGRKYYYAIVATLVTDNPQNSQRIRTSVPLVRAAVPHDPNPGIVYPYEEGEVLSNTTNLYGNNEAEVQVTYYDPTRADDHTYKILFHRALDQQVDLVTLPRWTLIDSTMGDTLLRQVRVDTAAVRVPTKGFSLEINSPLFGLRGVYETAVGNPSLHKPVFNVPSSQNRFMVVGAGSSQLDTILGNNATDFDIEIRFLGDSSWALAWAPLTRDTRWVRVPYTVWKVGKRGLDTVNEQRYSVIYGLAAGQSELQAANLLSRVYEDQPLMVFNPITVPVDSAPFNTTLGKRVGGTYYDDIPFRGFEGDQVRGWLWICGYANTTINNMVWKAYIADMDADGELAPNGTIIRFERYKIIRNGDMKVFQTSPVIANDPASTRAAVDRINVFPNPYYGVNRTETSRFQKFVTFNHLPYGATIRIFNIAGDVVRTLRKDDETQFTTWDLTNHNGLPVAGGIYLAHLELEDRQRNNIGTKTLKLMIVPEEQVLQVR